MMMIQAKREWKVVPLVLRALAQPGVGKPVPRRPLAPGVGQGRSSWTLLRPLLPCALLPTLLPPELRSALALWVPCDSEALPQFELEVPLDLKLVQPVVRECALIPGVGTDYARSQVFEPEVESHAGSLVALPLHVQLQVPVQVQARVEEKQRERERKEEARLVRFWIL